MKNLLVSLFGVAVILLIAEFTVGYIVPIRNVGPTFSSYHEDYGKHLKAGTSTVRKTPEFTMRLTANAYGFRGPDISALPENPVLFLGDSFTMGYGVNDGEEFPALVAAKLDQELSSSNIPVINAGIGNSGNGRWIKLLETMAKETQPRLVVMQVFENDFDNNAQERLFQLNETGELVALPIPEPGFKRKALNVIESIPGLMSTNLMGLVRQAQTQIAAANYGGSDAQNSPEDKAESDQLTYAIIEHALRICQENDWPVLGLIIGMDGERLTKLTDLFSEFGAETVRSPAKLERPDLYFEVDGHWNEKGHVDTASQLFQAMSRMNVGANDNNQGSIMSANQTQSEPQQSKP